MRTAAAQTARCSIWECRRWRNQVAGRVFRCSPTRPAGKYRCCLLSQPKPGHVGCVRCIRAVHRTAADACGGTAIAFRPEQCTRRTVLGAMEKCAGDGSAASGEAVMCPGRPDRGASRRYNSPVGTTGTQSLFVFRDKPDRK